jgi:hypothetical protein
MSLSRLIDRTTPEQKTDPMRSCEGAIPLPGYDAIAFADSDCSLRESVARSRLYGKEAQRVAFPWNFPYTTHICGDCGTKLARPNAGDAALIEPVIPCPVCGAAAPRISSTRYWQRNPSVQRDNG